MSPWGKECTMSKHTTMTTGLASLCALGEYLRRHCFFAPVREQVQIRQKTVRYRPMDKLLDALSGILCGAKTRPCTCTLRINRPCIPTSAPHSMKWATSIRCFLSQEVKRDTSQRTCDICRGDTPW